MLYKTRAELSSKCLSLRQQALDLLVGNHYHYPNSNGNGHQNGHEDGLSLLTKQRVSIFGDSKAIQPEDWIEVAVTNAPNPDIFQEEHLAGITKL
jgi:hypothetical protein